MSASSVPAGKPRPPWWPAARTLRLAEMYALGVLFLAFTAIALSFLLPYAWIAGLGTAGGVAALLMMLLGGTKVCYPLYFAGLVGAPLVFPGLPVSMNQALAALLFGAFCADLIKHRVRFAYSFPLGVFLVFQIYYITAAFVLRPPEAEMAIQAPFYILLTLIVVLFYYSRDWMTYLLRAMVFLTIPFILIPGMLEFVTRIDFTVTGPAGPLDRVDGFAKDAIQYSFTALWSMSLALFFFVEARNPFTKLFYGGTAFSLMFVSLVTMNRQTPIILAMMLVVFLLLVRYRWRPVLIGVLIVGAVGISPVVVNQVAKRFTSARSIMMDHSLTHRHDKFQIAREMIAANPVFGFGHNHFRYLWRQYTPLGNRLYAMHESITAEHYIDLGYLQIITDYGILGALLFLLLILSGFLLWYRLYKESRRFPGTWHTNYLAMVAALFTQLFISLLIQDTFTIPRTFILFGFLFVALPVVESERRRLAAAGDNGTEEKATAASP